MKPQNKSDHVHILKKECQLEHTHTHTHYTLGFCKHCEDNNVKSQLSSFEGLNSSGPARILHILLMDSHIDNAIIYLYIYL